MGLLHCYSTTSRDFGSYCPYIGPVRRSRATFGPLLYGQSTVGGAPRFPWCWKLHVSLYNLWTCFLCWIKCFAKVTKVLRCRIHSCCYEITHGWHRLIITRPHAKYQHDLIAVTVYCILHHIFLSTAENSHHWHTDWIDCICFYSSKLLHFIWQFSWICFLGYIEWKCIMGWSDGLAPNQVTWHLFIPVMAQQRDRFA